MQLKLSFQKISDSYTERTKTGTRVGYFSQLETIIPGGRYWLGSELNLDKDDKPMQDVKFSATYNNELIATDLNTQEDAINSVEQHCSQIAFAHFNAVRQFLQDEQDKSNGLVTKEQEIEPEKSIKKSKLIK